jgi:hypothetical protein
VGETESGPISVGAMRIAWLAPLFSPKQPAPVVNYRQPHSVSKMSAGYLSLPFPGRRAAKRNRRLGWGVFAVRLIMITNDNKIMLMITTNELVGLCPT